MITIRICTLSDIPKLQTFIDQKWRSGHILSHDAELLKWQHLDKVTGDLNYIVAERKEDNQIIAIFGYIPTYQYDEKLRDQKDFWLAIWKIDPDVAIPGVGNLLLRFFVDTYQPNSIGAIGINDKIEKFYKFLGYKPGVLNHYYFLNPLKTEFHIAQVENNKKLENKYISPQTLEELEILDNIPDSIYNPLKTTEYLKNRYLLHPFYKYRFWAVKNETKNCLALFVIRKITIKESSCLRIVDIFGNINEIDNLEHYFTSILQKENAEYIDCLNGGLPEQSFYNIGFSKLNDEITIPNYFEPFEKHNVYIKYAFKSSYDSYVMFKGDSDQDRPNIKTETNE